MGIILRVISWVRINGVALLGIVQGIVKVVKELICLIIDLTSLILGKTIGQALVDRVRIVCNVIDAAIEKAKTFLAGNLI